MSGKPSSSSYPMAKSRVRVLPSTYTRLRHMRDISNEPMSQILDRLVEDEYWRLLRKADAVKQQENKR